MNLTQNPLEVKDEGLKMPVTEDEKIAYIRKRNEERLSRVRVIPVLKEPELPPEHEKKKTNDELQEMLARLAKKSAEAKQKEINISDPLEKQIVEREYFLEQKRKTKEEQKEALEKSLKETSVLDSPASFSITQLIKMNLPEPRFAVPGVLQEGLTLLAGKPKKGKSWLALTLAMCVAHGRTTFGRFECPPSDVLYMPIEDRGNPYRLQRRCKLLLPKLLIDSNQLGNLQFEMDVSSSSKFIDVASDWIARSVNPKLIIVDTLAKIMPEGEYDNNDYKQAYRFMAGLQSWAIHNHIAVVVVHHTNKGRQIDPIDEVMGSAGLTAVADSIWVYTKIKGKNVLYLTSRDLDAEKFFIVDYKKKGYLQIEGELSDEEISPERKRVLDLLKEKPMSLKKASEILGMEYGNAKKLFSNMTQDGQIQKNDNGDFFVDESP